MKGMTNGATTTVSRLAWPVLLVLALALPGLAGCSNGVAAEDKSEGPGEQVTSLQQELATTNAELATATTERDAAQTELAAAKAAAETRRARSQASMDAVTKIIADPTAFGTEEEVLDELMTHVAPGARMTNAVFGSAPMRAAWRDTLFGGAGATIKNWHSWMSEDGSTGGALWTWAGTNGAGQPFELIGISITTFDDEGLETGVQTVFPYEDQYVEKAFTGQ